MSICASGRGFTVCVMCFQGVSNGISYFMAIGKQFFSSNKFNCYFHLSYFLMWMHNYVGETISCE